MSRVIPEDQPLSDEDREYLKERSEQWRIDTIDRIQTQKEAADDEAKDDDSVNVDADISEFVEGLTLDQVKERLELEEVDAEGVADDELVSLLAIHLQEQRSKGEEVDLSV